MTATLTIGVLGAARITTNALIRPAAAVPQVEIAAIAARDPRRAEAAAAAHGIGRVHGTYDDLLGDPAIQAVYIPLPASLHGRWTRAALAAGKHVLVEKPFTANADEAREVAAAATASGLVVMEAHHTSHHPQTRRAAELVASGVLGRLESASADFVVPIPPGGDIRWNLALGGGSLMDLGCYPLRWLRDVLGTAPTVISATATERDGIDATMDARLDYAGTPARVRAAMWSGRGIRIGVELGGTAGRMRVRGPYAPQDRGRIRIDGPDVHVREDADPVSSYRYQLEAFRDAVLAGGANITDAAAAVETMTSIDAIYRAAGMAPRPAGA